MTDAIISAIITGVLAITAELIISKRSTDKTLSVMQAQEEGRNNLLEEKLKGIHAEIEILSKRQDQHNKVIERTYALERDVKLMQAEDNRQNKRIEILETKGEHYDK